MYDTASSIKTGLKSWIKSMWPSSDEDMAFTIRYLVVHLGSRRILNTLYSRLPARLKIALYGRFCLAFRGYERELAEGSWRITFCNKEIVVPLGRKPAWLGWNVALSIQGQDWELKQTYASLIRLKHPPRLVIDIGANYGTHSIIFLSQGIETVSFEPNSRCHPFFRHMCAVNGFKYRLEPLAVGSTEGNIDLWYPEDEEWLGTTDLTTKDRLTSIDWRKSLTNATVGQTTIDAYVRGNYLHPNVLKIDTEGADIQVLAGARWTLSTHRPVVLFESWPYNRKAFIQVFDTQNYHICELPLSELSSII